MDNKKVSVTLIGIVGLIASIIGIFAYMNTTPINLSDVLMSAYKNSSDMMNRIIIMMISFIMIAFMLLTVPNKKIPILTNLGKNSLLVYLTHRFLTYPFNDMFPYKSYATKYFIYAFVVSIIVCIVFSNEKLNQFVSQKIALLSKCINDKEDKIGNIAKLVLLLLFVMLLIMKCYSLSI